MEKHITCCKHSRNWLERQGWRSLFITHNIETHLIPLFSVQCLIAHSMLYMESPRLEPFWINSIDNRKLVFNPGGRKLAMWLYGMGEGSLKCFFFKKIKYSWFTMLCQFLLYSKVTQSYICIHYFSHTIFHRLLSQETGYNSLCYIVGTHCLSILNVIVCIY